MKRKNDEVQMKEWVHKLHEAELENLPDKEELQEKYQLSDTFYARMEKLLNHQKKKGVRIRLKHGIAVAAAIAAAVCLIVNPQVGAKARDVIVQWKEKAAIFVLGPTNNEPVSIPEYVLTYVPEGFEWVGGEYAGPDYGGDALYYNDMKTLDFGYGPSGGTAFGVNDEYVIYHRITLSDEDIKVEYLESTNPDYMSSLLWKSENGEIAFCITADLDYEELMKVYEGVQIKK